MKGFYLCFLARSGEKKARQDQQLDRDVVEADPRLQRGHQNRSGEAARPRRALVPPTAPNASNAVCVSQSKGGILSKACDYIRELRQSNQRLQDGYKEVERVEMDNELLRQQVGQNHTDMLLRCRSSLIINPLISRSRSPAKNQTVTNTHLLWF